MMMCRLILPVDVCVIVCTQTNASMRNMSVIVCTQTNALTCDVSVFVYCKQTRTAKTNMYNDLKDT